jgi:hypothetical protein
MSTNKTIEQQLAEMKSQLDFAMKAAREAEERAKAAEAAAAAKRGGPAGNCELSKLKDGRYAVVFDAGNIKYRVTNPTPGKPGTGGKPYIVLRYKEKDAGGVHTSTGSMNLYLKAVPTGIERDTATDA